MGTTLTGKRVQNTYDSLLKITDNDNLTGVPKRITSGLGTDSPIYISTDKIGIGMSPTVQFQTSGDAEIGNDLVVGGDLTVNGTTTFIDSTIVEIGDNMIELAKDNTANIKDIGWYGTINDGSEKFVGVFYDASTGTVSETITTVTIHGILQNVNQRTSQQAIDPSQLGPMEESGGVPQQSPAADNTGNGEIPEPAANPPMPGQMEFTGTTEEPA